MRRAIAAAFMGGLVLGSAAVTPSFAATSGAGKAPGKAGPTATATTMKTVVYQGYEFQVPASWPVYRLDQHPQTCVRYDVHAVYLGTPGPDMRCPAGLVGRTQTVSFLPGKSAKPATKAKPSGRSARSGGTELQRSAATHDTVTRDTVTHQLSVTLGTGAPAATILGTYGSSPSLIEQVLGTVRQAPVNAVQSAQTGPAPTTPTGTNGKTSRDRSQSGAAAAAQREAPASTSWSGVPAHWPVETVQPTTQPTSPAPPTQPTPPPTPPTDPAKPTPPTRPTPSAQPTKPAPPTRTVPPTRPTPTPTPAHPVGGFDTCTAPSVKTMHVWRRNYAAVGVYIGGANSACAYGNLSASWVHTVTSTGWGVLPTYVGPQAPCWGGSGAMINAGKAAAQGKAAGSDAVSKARKFGLGTGSPIYYDMEAYNGGASCTTAVLQFLSAWDHQVAAAGYLTGVYSSQDSGIADMQRASAARTVNFTAPNAVWFALWDKKATLSDGNLSWPVSMRDKQYAGNVSATVGGITLNVDKDIVGGPVAH